MEFVEFSEPDLRRLGPPIDDLTRALVFDQGARSISSAEARLMSARL